MLFASVQLPVNTISLSRAPSDRATFVRASATAVCAAWPWACSTLDGLPNVPVKNGSIASTTRGSAGVVALLSR